MCELLPGLFHCQDAPDGGPDGVRVALALPPLGVFLGRGGVGFVTVFTVVGYPLLPRLFHCAWRLANPSPFGTHRCLRSTVGGDIETPERSIPRRGGALASTGWCRPLRHPDHP